ncbi:endonuclease domain-containing protein [Leifsonia sp. YAF41]|uniref:endonuclease domain-containing protein n=1 Tax=Leifsonia sp. YAF41 TaxID=3233086 RepID=UPI003F9DE943
MLRSLSADMSRCGNLATRAQLRELGYSRDDIGHAIADRQLWPIRRFWLAHPGADQAATRAVALGGRMAASSALASYGVWVTRSSGLWIGTLQGRSRLPAPAAGEHRLWVHEHFPHTGEKLWRMSLPDALAQYARVAPAPDVIASFDSALNKRLLRPHQLPGVFDMLPRRLRRLRFRLNGLADSGLESLMRVAAEAEGWQVDVQVTIAGVGRVDLLIDGWLVIELDGGQWHDDERSRNEDSRRDAEVTLLGYRCHRFRAHQVISQMPQCLDVIRTILAGGCPVAIGITA